MPAKSRTYAPQAKLIEFLVGILSGLEYLQDLNLAPRPLAKNLAVARALSQLGWDPLQRGQSDSRRRQ